MQGGRNKAALNLFALGDHHRGQAFNPQSMGKDYTYGRALKRDTFGVGDVTRSWMVNKQQAQKPGDIDYQKLNKLGLRQGVSNPMQAVEHRDNHRNVRLHARRSSGIDVIHGGVPGKSPVGGGKMTVRTMQGKSFCFGVPNRPSTPIKGIISQTMLAKDLEMAAQARQYEADNCATQIHANRRSKETKASQLTKNAIRIKLHQLDQKEQGIAPERFQMRRFSNISPKVENYLHHQPPQRREIQNARQTQFTQKTSNNQNAQDLVKMYSTGMDQSSAARNSSFCQ